MNTYVWQGVVLLAMLGCVGYWFMFRPYQIRVTCQKQATARYASLPGENDREVKIDVANQECLLRNGLY